MMEKSGQEVAPPSRTKVSAGGERSNEEETKFQKHDNEATVKAVTAAGQHKRARQNSAQHADYADQKHTSAEHGSGTGGTGHSSGHEYGNTMAKKPRETSLEPLGIAEDLAESGCFMMSQDSVTSQMMIYNVEEKPSTLTSHGDVEPTNITNNLEDSNIGNESDSDLDYDDLDELAVSSDVADFIDDDFGGDSGEDDTSVVSSTTSLSTGSVSSNTPSLVGENLESVNLGGSGGAGGVETGKKVPKWVSVAPNCTDSPALRRSLFANVPPTINFMLHNEISTHQLPDNVRKHLKWKLSTITPAIVKRTASNSGYRLMRKTCQDWHATWGKHMRSSLFKGINESQKINHFPGTFNIGRKDRLWRNYHRLMLKHGKAEFGFLPRTFVLPGDAKLLRKVWERRGAKGRWILKPPAMARGVGITVVNKLSKIPKNKPLVVQRYVARPYLINGTKFDLRLYLLVTSINPLRLYLYDDGLVRFASNKYSNDSKCVDDVYMHLTNYSINKNASNYTQNENSESCQGHKWTLKSLWRHFDAEGIDHTVVWEKIKDLMIKTVISAENPMSNLFASNVASRYSCYELFGFDILLDSKLKPWLIEVNISPSLQSSSSLDLDVKSHLSTELFNMARYHVPNKMKGVEQREVLESMGYENLPSLCLDKKLYVKEISKAERMKHDSAIDDYKNSVAESMANIADKDEKKSASASTKDDTSVVEPPAWILDHLTPDDTRQLVIAEDELATSRRFQRIFPTTNTHRYFKYFEKPRYYNLLLSAWEQKYSGLNRETGHQILNNLCLAKHHLKVPANVYMKKTSSGQQAIDISCLAAPTSEETKTDSNASTVVPASSPTAVVLTLPTAESLQQHQFPPTSTASSQVSPPLAAATTMAAGEDLRRLSASSTEMDCGESPIGTPEYTGNLPATGAGLDERLIPCASDTTDLTVVNENYKNSTLTTTTASNKTTAVETTTRGGLDNGGGLAGAAAAADGGQCHLDNEIMNHHRNNLSQN